MYPGGADYIVNGQPVQLKFGRSAKAIFKKLFRRDGSYKYPGQAIVTNKENKVELRALIEKNKHIFKGEEVVVNPPGIPEIKAEEVRKQLHRGFESMKIDAYDILHSKSSKRCT